MDRSFLLTLTTLLVVFISSATSYVIYSDPPSNPQLACGEQGWSQCWNGQNLPCSWLCDGMQDCEEGEDEAGCNNDSVAVAADQQSSDSGESEDSWENLDDTDDDSQCFSEDFQCANRECVPSEWRCDSDPDCSDGSDEWNCENYVAPANNDENDDNDNDDDDEDQQSR